jgi:hypothetical protein
MMLGSIAKRHAEVVYPDLPRIIQEKLCNPAEPEAMLKLYCRRESKYEALCAAFQCVSALTLGGASPPILDFMCISGLDESDLSVIRQRMLEAGWQPYFENWE